MLDCRPAQTSREIKIARVRSTPEVGSKQVVSATRSRWYEQQHQIQLRRHIKYESNALLRSNEARSEFPFREARQRAAHSFGKCPLAGHGPSRGEWKAPRYGRLLPTWLMLLAATVMHSRQRSARVCLRPNHGPPRHRWPAARESVRGREAAYGGANGKRGGNTMAAQRSIKHRRASDTWTWNLRLPKSPEDEGTPLHKRLSTNRNNAPVSFPIVQPIRAACFVEERPRTPCRVGTLRELAEEAWHLLAWASHCLVFGRSR
jgi:hypothetical protein